MQLPDLVQDTVHPGLVIRLHSCPTTRRAYTSKVVRERQQIRHERQGRLCALLSSPVRRPSQTTVSNRCRFAFALQTRQASNRIQMTVLTRITVFCWWGVFPGNVWQPGLACSGGRRSVVAVVLFNRAAVISRSRRRSIGLHSSISFAVCPKAVQLQTQKLLDL